MWPLSEEAVPLRSAVQAAQDSAPDVGLFRSEDQVRGTHDAAPMGEAFVRSPSGPHVFHRLQVMWGR
jgi:hypothetical protein